MWPFQLGGLLGDVRRGGGVTHQYQQVGGPGGLGIAGQYHVDGKGIADDRHRPASLLRDLGADHPHRQQLLELDRPGRVEAVAGHRIPGRQPGNERAWIELEADVVAAVDLETVVALHDPPRRGQPVHVLQNSRSLKWAGAENRTRMR